MKKIIAMLVACLMVVGMLAACGETQTQNPSTPSGNKGPVDITLTVWGPSEDQAKEDSFLQTACKQFAEANKDKWNITFKFGVCSEGDAGTKVTQDPSSAADVYMFANDQLGTLIQANAIAKLGGSALEQVKNNNSAAMIQSVSDAEGNVYGIPFTGNTWFMYYNKSILSEEDIKSLDAMMEKTTVAFPITNTWYLPAFFYACGGTMFGDGTNAEAGITFGGEVGQAATTYLVNAINSGKLINDAEGAGMDGLRNGTVGAMFSGTWDAANVAEALGENYGAVALPSITVNGEQKQLKSFAGSKALGVNPNSKNPAAAVALAAWLGSAEMQALHYELRDGGVVPCDINLLKGDEFSKNPAAVAQDATIAGTSVLQPSIPAMGEYWSNAESLGKALANKEITLDGVADAVEKWNNAINGAGSL